VSREIPHGESVTRKGNLTFETQERLLMCQPEHIHPVVAVFSLGSQRQDRDPRLVVEMEATPEANT
jgi:hypothetical protein